MNYSNIALSINKQVTSLKETVSNINSIDLASVWNSTAYKSLFLSLTNVIDDLNTEIGNLEQFSSALLMMDEYVALVKEIERMIEVYNSMPASTPEEVSAKENYGAQIEAKIVLKNELREKIVSILSVFGAISSEYSSINFVMNGYDSSIFYDEEFIRNLEDKINAVLLADDADGKNPQKVVVMKVMPKGINGVHSISDTLYVKLSDGNKYYINIKGTVDADSYIDVVHQGAYETTGYKKLDGLYQNHYDDMENGVFIRMLASCAHIDANSSVVQVMSDALSIPYNNTIVEGFSGAQASVMRISADICRETGKPPAAVSLVECHTIPYPWDENDVQALKDANAVIYSFYSHGDGNGSATKAVFTGWEEKFDGINMVYVDVNKGGHEAIFNSYLKSDILGFLSNETEFPSDFYASASKEIYDLNSSSWIDYDLTGKKTSDVFSYFSNDNYW